MSHPLFSVIIPAFNAGAKLESSVASALAQNAGRTVPLCEVWVIDGNSTDNTLALLQELQAQNPLLFWRSEPDKGVYDAMNKGIRYANGQFLYFLGAGDVLRPGALAEVAVQPNLHPLLLIYGKVWSEAANQEYGTHFELCDLARRNIPHQATFYGRDIFALLGEYNLKYPVYADHEFNWRCFTSPRVETRFLDRIVADFESGGISQSQADPQFHRDWTRIVWRGGGLVPWACLQLFRRVSTRSLAPLGKLRSLLRLSR